MFCLFSRKAALSLILSLLFLVPSVSALAEVPTSGSQLACELEGNVVSAGVMATSVHAHSHNTVTNSLWGNLLLNMAYQQDKQLQNWMKALHRVDAFTMGSVTAISALGLTQSIYGYRTLQVEPHPKPPGVLGLINASGSLGSLLVRLGMNHHYGKRIAKRQAEISTQVQNVLAQLKDGAPFANVQPALTTLVGEEATEEFSEIWHVTHPH